MRSVAVDLDARLGLRLAVGVSSDVVAAVDDCHLAAGFGGTLGDGEAEETRPDDKKIHVVHRIGVWLGA